MAGLRKLAHGDAWHAGNRQMAGRNGPRAQHSAVRARTFYAMVPRQEESTRQERQARFAVPGYVQ